MDQSVTWPGIRQYLSPAGLKASFEVNQALQAEYTRVYLEEFDATIITGAPPKTTEFFSVKPNLAYDYTTFKGVLAALDVWDVIRTMEGEAVLQLKYSAGFLDFIAAFDQTCNHASSRLEVIRVFASAYHRLHRTDDEGRFGGSWLREMISRLQRGPAAAARLGDLLFQVALFVRKTVEDGGGTSRDSESGISSPQIQFRLGPTLEVNMSVFDQRGQRVVYQYNAAGDINLDGVGNRAEFTEQLQKLQQEINRAREASALSEDAAAEGEYHLKKAAIEAKKPDADKGSLLKYLGAAKGVFEAAAAAGGLVTAISKALEVAQKLF
jgi:hypothetical protein